jgi:hypothetical protein
MRARGARRLRPGGKAFPTDEALFGTKTYPTILLGKSCTESLF